MRCSKTCLKPFLKEVPFSKKETASFPPAYSIKSKAKRAAIWERGIRKGITVFMKQTGKDFSSVLNEIMQAL